MPLIEWTFFEVNSVLTQLCHLTKETRYEENTVSSPDVCTVFCNVRVIFNVNIQNVPISRFQSQKNQYDILG